LLGALKDLTLATESGGTTYVDGLQPELVLKRGGNTVYGELQGGSGFHTGKIKAHILLRPIGEKWTGEGNGCHVMGNEKVDEHQRLSGQ
jgi:hypothetical protein